MNQQPCNKPATNPLPDFHFAILFEGAWVFTPYEGGKMILATCPITDDMNGMHQSRIGIWNAETHLLDPVGCIPEEVDIGDFFTLDIDGICDPVADFSTLFCAAAARYPFVHVPLPTNLRIPGRNSVRAAVLPIPTDLRVAGALMTAEVHGKDAPQLFGTDVVVKRAFVDFIFVYRYDGCLIAKITKTGTTGQPASGTIRASADEPNTCPHLIIDIFPTADGMNTMYKGCCPVDKDGNVMGPPDQSAQKVHAATTFDLLRRSMSHTSGESTSCCDIILLHNEDDMYFNCGDSGLTQCELGLSEQCPICDAKSRYHLWDAKLPSCAGGGVSGGG